MVGTMEVLRGDCSNAFMCMCDGVGMVVIIDNRQFVHTSLRQRHVSESHHVLVCYVYSYQKPSGYIYPSIHFPALHRIPRSTLHLLQKPLPPNPHLMSHPLLSLLSL